MSLRTLAAAGLAAALLGAVPASAQALRYSPVPRDGAGPGRCPTKPPAPGPAITGLDDVAAPKGSAAARRQAGVELGKQAYTYGFPLVDVDRILDVLTKDDGTNRFLDATRLGSPTDRAVVAPNSDTLYSLAELDVSDEPLVLTVPDTGGRWYDMEFVEPYTNVFGYVGQRVSGTKAGAYAIVGPTWGGKLPKGMRCVVSSADRIWLIGRTLVTSPGDLPAAQAVQRQYGLTPLSDYKPGARPPRHGTIPEDGDTGTTREGMAFFDALSSEMKRSPPPERDKRTLKQLAAAGITPGGKPSKTADAAVKAGLVEGIAAAKADLRAEFLRVSLDSARAHNGWLWPPDEVGAFGTDYVLRTNAAIYGIGINRPVEAVYLVGVLDSTGAPLAPGRSYKMTFPPGQLPPVNAWWSLTMYDADGFLVANPLGRYAVSDRSGVQPNPDGSVDLLISPEPPADRQANWLPIPSTGMPQPFLRAYSLRNEPWEPPPIVPVG